MKDIKNPKEFLKSNLKKIFLEIEGIEISYEFRLSSSTHLVEVKPKSIYDSKAYIDKEIELEERFYENFPNEDLMFINENSLTQLMSPEFSFKFKVRYDLFNLFTPMKVSNFQEGRQLPENNNLALAA